MRAFLSKVLLSAFIVLFALPSTLLAQTGNWTAPSGPPLGNNVPAPVNVGPLFQSKEGPLQVKGTVTVGDTGPTGGPSDDTYAEIVSTGAIYTPQINAAVAGNLQGLLHFFPASSIFYPSSPNMLVNELKTYFINNFDVGVLGNYGPEIKLFGKLQYKPLETNGQLSPNIQPQTGYVLKAIDDEGRIGWAPDNTGTGGCTPGVDCPSTPPCTPGPNCWPIAGSAGKTMWYNGTNGWEATDQIFHDIYSIGGGALNVSRTTLNNEYVDIKGIFGVNIGTVGNGTTQIDSPDVKIMGDSTVQIGHGSAANSEISINSPIVKFGNDGPNGDYQRVDVKSGQVNFAGPDDGGYQTVTLDSEKVLFRGVNMNPGIGRIPYAMDDNGRFTWNPEFRYQLLSGPGLPYPVGNLTLANPAGGTSVFQNQGMSSLWGDVYVGNSGSTTQTVQGDPNDSDLYLYGIGSAQPSQRGIGIIKPLCYVTTTKKVVTCADDPVGDTGGAIGVDPDPVIEWPTDFEIIKTHEDSPGTYTFQYDQTVTLQWCGGGGGGGGGGIGGDVGTGGGGGGGGKAGNCMTQDLAVTPGDVLSWDIGDGGNGGAGASYKLCGPTDLFANACSNQNSVPLVGGAGGPTMVYFNDNGSGPVQIGTMQVGGTGGNPGQSDNVPGSGFDNSPTAGGFWGGQGANDSLPSWHDGGSGRGSTNGNYGGYGGDGESPAGDVTYSSPSGGGNRGLADDTADEDTHVPDNSSPSNFSFSFGGPGHAGDLGFGGGGGGGGYGGVAIYNPDDPSGGGSLHAYPFGTEIKHGGGGAKGGSGYVKISGLYNSTNSTGIDLTTPGVHTLHVQSDIPAGVSHVNIEIWGGGGGGGGVLTSGWFVNRHGGGAGAGGYQRIENVPKTILGNVATNDAFIITVGAGGNAGSSSDSGATNGGAGGDSQIENAAGTVLIGANGGHGGGKDVSSTGSPYGLAGAGGGFYPGPVSTASGVHIIYQNQGHAGVSISDANGGNWGGSGTMGIGAGGEGADTNWLGTGTSVDSVAGGPGRVRISW